MESMPKFSVFYIVTAGNHRGLGFRTPCTSAVREEWLSISVIRQTSGAHGTSLSLLSGRGTPTHSEDVVYREVTADHQLFSRRLLTKTNRLPRWAERFFPSGMSRSVYIIEDSIVDPVNRTLTTYTWNLNHTTIMSVEERCIFQDSAEDPATTRLKREAWISSSIYGFSRPIQEFGLARFKSNQVKAMKGLEYALSNLQGEATPWLLRDSVKDTSGKAKEAAKNLASAAASPQKPQQYI